MLEILIICTMGFIAAAVDAMAGGGGLISLPTLLFVGVPPHLALGTNKLASTAGSLTSSITFMRSGKLYLPLLKWQIPFTFVGASLGVIAVLNVSPDYLHKVVLILILLVSLYTLLKKNLGLEDHFTELKPTNIISGILFAFFIGFYDGFFGPGTGSFLIFAFITIFGFDFIRASANAKALNFTSNFVSLLLFAINHKIYYLYGVPMAFSMYVGSRVGTRLAIKGGARFVKPIFVTMSILVGIKLIYQLF